MAQPFAPQVEAVHAYLAHRLQGEPFTQTSVPSERQVVTIINDVAEEVASVAGGTVGADQRAQQLARFATTIGAAALVESTLWPEQHDNTDESTYGRLDARYQRLLDRLRDQSDAESELTTIRTPTPWAK